MDASDAAILCSQANTRGTGKGCINSPNILRSSRSLEHRAHTDAQLRLYPSYKDENDSLQTLLQEQQCCSSQPSLLSSEEGDTDNTAATITSPMTPPPTNQKHIALRYATQISGRDFLADLQYLERKDATDKHIIMLL